MSGCPRYPCGLSPGSTGYSQHVLTTAMYEFINKIPEKTDEHICVYDMP